MDHLSQLPHFAQEVPDFQAAIYAMAKETDLLEEARLELQRNLFVQLADEYIHIYEQMLGINSDPTLSLEQRKNVVMGYYQRARGGAVEYPAIDSLWVSTMNTLIGTGWDHVEHVPGDVSTPAEGHLRIILPFADNTPEADRAELLFRAFTPANLILDYTHAAGFILDRSLLDDDPLIGS